MRQEMKIKLKRRKAPAAPQSSPAPETKEGPAMPEELLTVREACSFAKVSQPTMYRWVNQEGLPAYRSRGLIRIDKADLINFLKGKTA